MQVDDPLALADERGTAADAGDAQHVLRDDVVARAQEAVEHDREHEHGREDQEGAEVVAGADGEDERDHRHEDERGDDAPDPRPRLARRVEAVAPEDEHRDQADERHPVALGLPEDPPERRAALVHLLEHEP